MDWAENGVDAVEGRNWAPTRNMTDGIARMASVPAQERLKRREKSCFMLVYRPFISLLFYVVGCVVDYGRLRPVVEVCRVCCCG